MWVLIFWEWAWHSTPGNAFTRQETTEAEVQAEIRRMKGPGSGTGD